MDLKKIFCLAAGVFLSMGLFGDGVLFIPKTAQEIRIDGNIEESEGWNRAVRLTNFQLKNQIGFASEQTTAWITHDGSKLYIALKMQAQVLQHSSNQRSRFLATVKPGETGKKIWNDDSIEVRLRPPWTQKISADSQFYLIANANGACSTFAPKGNRQDWYKEGELKAAVGEGFWSVEMAFPLKTFGGEKMTGAELAGWGLNFIRFEQNRNEVSSLANISGKSHMDTKLYVKMTLDPDDGRPAIRMPDITNGDLSKVFVEHYTAHRLVASGWSVTESLRDRRQRFERSKLAVFNVNGTPVQIKPEFNGKGSFRWYCYFCYGKPLKTLFRSPDYPGNSDQGPVLLELKRPETVKSITVNRQVLKPQAQTEFFPQAGGNRLDLSTGLPSISIKLSNAGLDMPLDKWRYFDGSQWHSAKCESSGGWLTVSAPAGQAEYRFSGSFMSNASVLQWMGESDNFNLNAGSIGYFFWVPNRSNGIQLVPDSRISLTLLLPAWLKIASASSCQVDSTVPWYQNKPAFKNLYQVKAGADFPWDGQKYRLWTVSSDQAGRPVPAWDIVESRIFYRTRCLIVLQADSDAAGRTGKIGYCMSVNGEPETLSFRDAMCLPKLNGLQPKHIRFTMHLTAFSRHDSPGMAAQLKTIRAAGGNEAFIDNVYADFKPGLGITQSYFFHLRGGLGAQEIDMRKIFSRYPQTRGWGNYANLAALNRIPEVWPMLDAEFAALRERDPQAKNLFWDYEFRPFRHYSDLSEWTLKVFAKEYNISEWPLDQQIIQQKYLDQWVDFRCRELARIVPKLRKLAHKHGFEFSMYGSPNPIYKKEYCFDWPMIANEGGLDRIYFGGDWNASITESFLKSAAKTETPVMASIHVCSTDNTGWKRGLILRRLLLSRGGGVLLWYEKGFDGLMLQEIAAVTRLAATYEDFFRKGVYRAYGSVNGVVTYADSNQTPENLQKSLLGDVRTNTAGLIVLEWNGQFLALAINDMAVPVSMKLKMDRAAGSFRDAESGKTCPAGQELELKIPAYGYSAFTGKIR